MATGQSDGSILKQLAPVPSETDLPPDLNFAGTNMYGRRCQVKFIGRFDGGIAGYEPVNVAVLARQKREDGSPVACEFGVANSGNFQQLRVCCEIGRASCRERVCVPV